MATQHARRFLGGMAVLVAQRTRVCGGNMEHTTIDRIEHTCRLMHMLSLAMLDVEDTFGLEVMFRGLYNRLWILLEELEREGEAKDECD